jgi:hypothetical protein
MRLGTFLPLFVQTIFKNPSAPKSDRLLDQEQRFQAFDEFHLTEVPR